jgi:hypothetical protein
VTKVLTDNTKKKNLKGVLKEQLISVGYTENEKACRLKFIRIIYKAKDAKIYELIIYNMTLPATQIAKYIKIDGTQKT